MNSLQTLAVAFCFAAIPALPARGAAIYNDAWDVAQGTTVLSHSGTGHGDITNMIGNGLSDPEYGEAGFALFRDFQPAGTTHWVEWQTASTILLTGYVLNLADDEIDSSGNRGISDFRLYGRLGNAEPWVLLDTFAPSSHPYGILEHTGSFAAVELNEFRAEFVQYSDSIASGPRIAELDAITVPEPSTPVLAAFAAFGLTLRRNTSGASKVKKSLSKSKFRQSR